jgi:nitrate reductase (NAD(P)H)
MSQDIRPLIDEDTQLPDMDLSDTNPRLPPTPPYSIHDKPGAYWQSASPSPSRRNSTVHTKLPFPLPPSYTPATKILEIDKKTPDNHVPRDPRLIRLTGTHPFNVEAPLSSLYDEGFLTSPSNFYVRNHGPVPQVSDAEIPDWSFTIEGLVEHPITITLRALIEEYEQVTVPITLVCAGNRRKEQNVVRKSKGFSWGAAGVSNALWTGVPLCEVLKRAAPKRRARYVCMEGAETLPNGNYGTSVKLNWALDPNRGIMLAHMMNGETLTPDHGKPLRVVVPGMIGGRSVKWLKRIIVSEGPSENWYHINDNRVLPTMVSPEMSATEEGKKWWMDERYAIYDLSTNSATVYPAHDEVLRLDQGKETYTVRGYAYGGGGRRVTRVEISLDQGRSWMLADINYDEDKYRDLADENQQLCNGRLDVSWRETCFCWCFWHLEVPVAQLGDAKDILVRAMDESLSVQPRDMYWSVLGMMNNPWFRVAIIREGDALRFEHPTQPALIPGGWMERVKKAGGDLSNGFWGEQIGGQALQQVDKEVVPEVKMTNEDVKREITIEELRAHESETEPWFVVNGEVYDGTGFLEGHPGGVSSIVNSGAQDVTDEFMAIRTSPFPVSPLLLLSPLPA